MIVHSYADSAYECCEGFAGYSAQNLSIDRFFHFMSIPRNTSGTYLFFWQFLSTSVISAVTGFFFFLSVFDFLLCIAFTTSHMFLVNASVNVFLMPSSSGFHVVSTQTVPCSSLPFGSNYFLTAFFIPAALPFLSLKPLKVFSFFLLCKSHTP